MYAFQYLEICNILRFGVAMSSEHVGHLDALRVPGPTCGYAPQLPADNVTRANRTVIDLPAEMSSSMSQSINQSINQLRLANGNVIIHESINQSINQSTCHRLVVESSMSSIFLNFVTKKWLVWC
jgi:hypothetical protein